MDRVLTISIVPAVTAVPATATSASGWAIASKAAGAVNTGNLTHDVPRGSEGGRAGHDGIPAEELPKPVLAGQDRSSKYSRIVVWVLVVVIHPLHLEPPDDL